MNDKIKTAAVCLLAIAVCLGSSSCQSSTESGKPVIGLSLDNLQLERWQRDRDFFVAKANELGAEVIVQSANSDDARQISQCENMLTRGVDLLVVIPHNGKVAAAVVEMAHQSGVKVLAYDRIINDSDLDLYLSFDNVQVGEMQAQYLVERAPQGNYVLIGGSPTDNNAQMFRQGQMNVLQPYLDRGEIIVVADQWATDWQPIEALRHVENALTQADNDVVAIVTSNDATAGGAIQALAEQNLAGQVLVSGQDADLPALPRLLDGTQSMTVYKPVKLLAETAAKVAMQMIEGTELTGVNTTVHNGKIDVPSILLTPLMVDKANLAETVIEDGFHSVEAVYQNVPRSEWPELEE